MTKTTPPRISKHTLPITPDGRYFVVRGRLWRTSNPHLEPETRKRLVHDLMKARRDVASALKANDAAALKNARSRVNAAKIALGERGPVWWDDGEGDLNQKHVTTTRYAEWFDHDAR